jgi:thiol-disulfide isomerase/thioredoxin
MQASLLATPEHNYTTAYKKTAETGQPLVVLVGADWCPGCRTMKTSVIPQLEKQGGLKNVAFACLNTDQEREIAGKLMQGGSIPQLIMFTKTAEGGWKRTQLTGAHSARETQSFINAGTAIAAQQPIAKLSSK